jgi:flagellar hook-associated protein 1 FlgK
MSGLLNALNIGKTSLSANQKSIEVVGNNIANVNTPGYSRQQTELSGLPVVDIKGFFVGQGVTVGDIVREHDVFITNQVQDKSSTVGEESGKAAPLSAVERVFNISDQNLAAEISRYFDAWQELTVNPGGTVERDAVIMRGTMLADTFHNAAQQLDVIKKDINSTLSVKIDDVNLVLQEVADLNDRIAQIEIYGHTANSFRDQRDLLVEQLSASLGVKTFEHQDGKISVNLPSGHSLVNGNSVQTLAGVDVGDEFVLQLRSGDVSIDLDQGKIGGEFKGLMEVRDTLVSSLQDDLDLMAYTLVGEVNNLHESGMGLDGIGSRSFFTPLTEVKDASRNISVALQEAYEVACGNSDAVGDNTNALSIAALGEEKVVNGRETFTEFYGRLSARVGGNVAQNELNLTGAEDALVQLKNLRDGRVGVSIEEEMINLIQYQRGFEASAKLLSTVDEMMATLVSLKR